jgi:hypothetical protein
MYLGGIESILRNGRTAPGTDRQTDRQAGRQRSEERIRGSIALFSTRLPHFASKAVDCFVLTNCVYTCLSSSFYGPTS